ncbi:hypothetical protein ACTG9Q_05340 [Actinokineospora sp. 24-640]
MDLDHLSSSATDARSAAGGDPFGGTASRAFGARSRALAGLPANTAGGVQHSWEFTTISVPRA